MKTYIALGLLIAFIVSVAYDRYTAKTKWSYNVVYSYKTGIGRVFITRASPIKSSEDVEEVEKLIISQNEKLGYSYDTLFLVNWIELR